MTNSVEYQRKYYAANRERIKEIKKKSDLRRAEHKREYYLAHRDEILKYKKEYSLTHREKIREKGKKYHLANRDQILEKQKKHYLAHEDLYRDYHYKKSYGIDLNLVRSLVKEQNNQCAICLGKISFDLKRTHKKRAFIDHNHKTGQLRKALCRSCNTGIGLFREDPSVMNKAINYLCSFTGGGELLRASTQ